MHLIRSLRSGAGKKPFSAHSSSFFSSCYSRVLPIRLLPAVIIYFAVKPVFHARAGAAYQSKSPCCSLRHSNCFLASRQQRSRSSHTVNSSFQLTAHKGSSLSNRYCACPKVGNFTSKMSAITMLKADLKKCLQ